MGLTAGIYEVAKCGYYISSSDFSDQNADMTWSLILWDYLITLDDEVRPYCSSRDGLSTDQLEDHFILGASSFWHDLISVWLKIGWTVLKNVMGQILILCGKSFSAVDTSG